MHSPLCELYIKILYKLYVYQYENIICTRNINYVIVFIYKILLLVSRKYKPDINRLQLTIDLVFLIQYKDYLTS